MNLSQVVKVRQGKGVGDSQGSQPGNLTIFASQCQVPATFQVANSHQCGREGEIPHTVWKISNEEGRCNQASCIGNRVQILP
jgi:hypothetical protein